MNFFFSFFTVVKVSYFLVKMSLLKQAFQLISVFPLLKLIAKFVFQIQPLSPICLIKDYKSKMQAFIKYSRASFYAIIVSRKNVA